MPETQSDKSALSRRVGIIAVALTSAFILAVAAIYFRPGKLRDPAAVKTEPGPVHVESTPAPRPQLATATNSNRQMVRRSETMVSAPVRSPEDARALLGRLFQMDLSSGTLSDDQIALINGGFKQLGQLGPAAIPVIKEFLAQNAEISFSDVTGGEKADYSSLRMGLFDTLKQIGGDEGTDATLEVLKSTADPWEVAILTRNLEQLAPGEYRDESIKAVRESLAQALEEKVPGRDVAPLFQVIQAYGREEVIPDLEKAMSKWSYYSAITLGSLPDGMGIPVLVQTTQDPAAAASGQADIAMQILAQLSPTQPDAARVLLAKAQANQISEGSWAGVASALGGTQLELGTPLADNVAGQKLDPSMQQYRVDQGGQSLFSIPTTASMLEEQLPQRMALIDQLLASATQPTAIQALQAARSSLQNKAIALVIPP